MTVSEQFTVAIVGNDLAAWMAAAFSSSQPCFGSGKISIYTGVSQGEHAGIQCTLPDYEKYLIAIRAPLHALIKENAANRTLGSCYQLQQRDFWHIWGEYGASQGAIEFHQLISRLLQEGTKIDFENLSVAAALAKRSVFKEPTTQAGSIFATYKTGVCLNTEIFISILKKICHANHVVVNTKKVVSVELGKKNQPCIRTDDGVSCNYNLVINTSREFINKDRGFENWSEYLPFTHLHRDERECKQPSYTQIIGFREDFGWNTKAVVANRMETVKYRTVEQVDFSGGAFSIQEVGILRIFAKSGILHIGKNAMNIPSPLFSEADLVWISLNSLWKHFVHVSAGYQVDQVYNQILWNYLENLRDLTQRAILIANAQNNKILGECSVLKISSASRHKYDLFCHRGRIAFYEQEYFTPLWQIWLFLGLGVIPTSVDSIVAGLSSEEVNNIFSAVGRAVKKSSENI